VNFAAPFDTVAGTEGAPARFFAVLDWAVVSALAVA
jgi:hypothetical protein